MRIWLPGGALIVQSHCKLLGYGLGKFGDSITPRCALISCVQTKELNYLLAAAANSSLLYAGDLPVLNFKSNPLP